MVASADEFWRGCLEDLATRLPAQSLETWIRPIQPRDLAGGCLRLEVPSQFFVDWLSARAGRFATLLAA